MDIFRLFRKKPTPAPSGSDITPGSLWIFKSDDGSPWPRKGYKPVTVLDYKNGWVRYDMGGFTFRDERMREDTFRHCYEPHR